MNVKLFLMISVLSIVAIPVFSVNVQAANCLQAGSTGLTASIVAHPAQKITGVVDARVATLVSMSDQEWTVS